MKILVVDDEVRIAEAIKQGLELDGYAVDVEHDGEDGYNAARADEYDVIVLDANGTNRPPTDFRTASKRRA
jgi:two-component system, OmpR family, response regulator